MFDDTFSIPLTSFSGDGRKNRLKVSATLLGAGLGALGGFGLKRLVYGDRGGVRGDIIGAGAGAVAGGIAGNLAYKGAKKYSVWRRQRKADSLIAATDDPDRKRFIRELTEVPTGMVETGTLADANMRNAANAAIAKRVVESGIDPSMVPVYSLDRTVDTGGTKVTKNLFGDVDIQGGFNAVDQVYDTSKDEIRGVCLTPFASTCLHYKGDAQLARQVYDKAMEARRNAAASGDGYALDEPADNFVSLQDNDHSTSRSYALLGAYGDISKALHRKDGKRVNLSNVYSPVNDIRVAEGVFDEETWHQLNGVTSGNIPRNWGFFDDADADEVQSHTGEYERNTAEGLVALAGLKRIMYSARDADGKRLYTPDRGITVDQAIDFMNRDDFNELAGKAGYDPKSIPTLHRKILAVRRALNEGGYFGHKMRNNFSRLFDQAFSKDGGIGRLVQSLLNQA